jgi:hypothetical protein
VVWQLSGFEHAITQHVVAAARGACTSCNEHLIISDINLGCSGHLHVIQLRAQFFLGISTVVVFGHQGAWVEQPACKFTTRLNKHAAAKAAGVLVSTALVSSTA